MSVASPPRYYFESSLTRDQLIDRFNSVRAFTDKLCEPLETEDYVVQSMEDASPARWHIAHTTWFFETFFLQAADPQYRPLHPQYAFLFNSYYAQAGKRYPRPRRGLITRPTVQQVFEYRKSINEAVNESLATLNEEAWQRWASVVEIGIHHEQQHQELLLTDLKHALSFNPLYPAYKEVGTAPHSSVETLKWTNYEGGIYGFGHPADSFCYDNETPRHQRLLYPFQIADRLVTNGEYLQFIEDGGYQTEPLWLSDGFAAAGRESWNFPLYWVRKEEDWYQFTLNGLQKLDPDEPVSHVSYYEADAYASWLGARLATEFEWELAARSSQPATGNFVEDGHLHPLAADSGTDSRQFFGDLWEWTASPYTGYPGFQAMKGALGEYNGKFMSGQMVLRGGSCGSSQSHIRPTYRNFFYPSARWQFTGIRLAKDASSH